MKNKIKPRPANSIGGSNAPGVCGVSPYTTVYEEYQQFTGEAEPKESTPIMTMGNVLEPMILEWAEGELGYGIVDRQLQIRDPETDYRHATLDGRVDDKWHIQAKSTRSRSWGEPPDDIPIEVVVQCQHEMSCSPTAEVTFIPVLFVGPGIFKMYKLERDEELIATIREREAAFWTMVQTRTPPPPTTYQEISAAFPRSTGGIIEADEATMQAHLDLLEVRRQKKELDGREDQLKLQLCEYLGENEVLSCDGNTLATWRTSKPISRTDWKGAAREAHIDQALIDAHTTTKPGTRRLLIK